MSRNNWDKLSSVFSNKSHPALADNVEILWPFVVKLLQHCKEPPASVLDYGCGGGGFCRSLYSNGYDVVGIDYSKKMVSAARKKTPNRKIKYIFGDVTTLGCEKRYNIITSLMVFQFIRDIDEHVSKLSELLSDGGSLFLAVFNPAFVTKCIRAKLFFKSGSKLNINGVDLDIFIRSKADYHKIFSKYGLKLTGAYYPKFTKSFIKKYKWPLPKNDKEYLVMVFKKKLVR